MMKQYTKWIAAACVSVVTLLVVSCSDDNEQYFTTSQTDFNDVTYEGGELNVDVDSYNGWTASSDADWCTVSPDEGENGKSSLKINVEGNIQTQRSATITIRTQKESRTIKVSQQGLPAGTIFHYKLPIVFHVIYEDSDNEQQNIPAKRLNEMMDTVNKLYKDAGFQSRNMDVEFVPATVDPYGKTMQEPGIDRIKYYTSSLNMNDVMFGNDRKYNQFLWDPNKYVNVLIYTFAGSPGTVGVSHFPYSPENYPMNGTDTTPYDYISLENLPYAYCVSLNNVFAKKGTSTTDIGKLQDLQTDLGHALAHELGHYLGLRHTFSESSNGGCEDTDFCNDTPSYDYNEYIYQAQVFLKKWQEGSIEHTFDNFLDLFNRSSCLGSPFVAHNIMDYEFGYSNQFTSQQLSRVRHVLTYSPLIPGPKIRTTSRSRLTRSGVLNLPIKASVCPPHMNFPVIK